MRSSQQTSLDLDQYEQTECLGAGSFGRVYKAQHRKTKEQVAIKVVDSSDLDVALNQVTIITKMNQGAQNEKQNHRADTHARCLKIIGAYRKYNQFFIVMQFYGRSLTEIAKKKEARDFQFVFQVFRAAVEAMAPLRKHKIIHRDIKADNILMTYNEQQKKYRAKICDFGLAIFEKDSKTFSSQKIGTLTHMAPQALKFGQYSQKSEIWSLGIVLYYLLYRRLPFDQKFYTSEQKLYEAMVSEQVKYNKIPASFAKLCSRCLTLNENKRASYQELVDCLDNMEGNLKYIVAEFQKEKGNENENRLCRNIGCLQIENASTTGPTSQTCSDIGGEQKCLNDFPQGEAVIAISDLQNTITRQMSKMFEILRQNLVKIKGKKQAENNLILLCEKILREEDQKTGVFFTGEVMAGLHRTISKMKLVCEYADDDNKISFNLREFVVSDILLTVYQLISWGREIGIQSSEFTRGAKNRLDEFLEDKPEKGLKYYKQLRNKILLFQ